MVLAFEFSFFLKEPVLFNDDWEEMVSVELLFRNLDESLRELS